MEIVQLSLVPNIVFDLDGTLVDSAPSLCKAGNQLLDRLGRPQIQVETYKSFIGKGLAKQVEQLLEHTGGVPDGDLDRYFRLFRDYYNLNPLIATTPYAGVHDCLEALKNIPANLAICTQKLEKPARYVLSGLNLEHYFEGFAFGDSLPVMKPHPEMVKCCTKSFQNGPLIYIGDSETDAVTAKNAGAVFLLFNGGYRNLPTNKIDNHSVFYHHNEILTLVQKILNNGM